MKKVLFYVLCLTLIAATLAVWILPDVEKVDAQSFSLSDSLTDQAQRTTLAFAGLGMMTGNLDAQSFFPPGKVADYTGFQYLRDNDPDGMGHNTSFLTRVANNVIYILNDAQFNQLKAVAVSQQDLINQYGYKRYPLMHAFRRLIEGNVPSGSIGLSLSAVKQASRELYLIDGQISFDRAMLYANVLNSMDTTQKAYLANMKGKGFNSWPDITSAQIQGKMSGLPQGTAVAVMTYAGDLFSWYAGSVDADVYFCPERHGTYYGSFYMKDAPAVGHEGYSINEQLTATAGSALCDSSKGYVTSSQAAVISSLVDTQRNNLYASSTASIVSCRTQVATLLRSLLVSTASSDSVKAQVLSLSGIYGDLDGENNYSYATVFAQVYKTLTTEQKSKLMALRQSILSGTYSDGTPFDYTICTTPYLYSATVADSAIAPYISNTDYLFSTSGSASTIKLLGADEATASGGHTPNYFQLTRWVASGSGSVTKVRVKGVGAGNAKVAIYSDSSGSPGTLMGSNSTGQAVTASGWQDISLSAPLAVTSGTAYWIGINSDGACLGYVSGGSGTVLFRSVAYSGFSFPSAAGTGFSSYGGYTLAAGWGTTAGSTAPLVTTGSGASNISTTGATLNGSLTTNGGASTLVSIYWGPADGGTTAGSWAHAVALGTTAAGTFSTAVSGLTPGSTYYYRCYAVNSEGTSWSSVASFTAISSVTTVKLLGADEATASGGHTPNYFQLTRWVASGSGSVTKVRVKGVGVGNAKVAIYSDSSGSPGTLLGSNSMGQAVTASGWQDISLSAPLAVTSGTAYWIGINSDGACLGYVSGGSGTVLFRSVAYSGFSFPSAAGTGFSSYGGYTLAAGWGTIVSVAVPSIPAAISPWTAVNFEWASSTGATKYSIQVNTSSSFNGTSLFNGDVTSNSQIVSGISAGTTYYWHVRAGNDTGWSSWSPTRSVIVNSVP